MQILAIPPGIAAVCALPRPKIHQFYWSHQASNTALAPILPASSGGGRLARGMVAHASFAHIPSCCRP
ncbi:hypothetical protein FUT63_09840 [Extensimonas vulgaris]|nr:hypothetical protein FUT63_09840 [Extensimonas vulgaris]